MICWRLTALRNSSSQAPMPRTVVVIEEIADHAPIHKFLLTEIADKGEVLLVSQFARQSKEYRARRLRIDACSAASTAFQSVCGSAYAPGVLGGSMTSTHFTRDELLCGYFQQHSYSEYFFSPE